MAEIRVPLTLVNSSYDETPVSSGPATLSDGLASTAIRFDRPSDFGPNFVKSVHFQSTGLESSKSLRVRMTGTVVSHAGGVVDHIEVLLSPFDRGTTSWASFVTPDLPDAGLPFSYEFTVSQATLAAAGPAVVGSPAGFYVGANAPRDYASFVAGLLNDPALEIALSYGGPAGTGSVIDLAEVEVRAETLSPGDLALDAMAPAVWAPLARPLDWGGSPEGPEYTFNAYSNVCRVSDDVALFTWTSQSDDDAVYQAMAVRLRRGAAGEPPETELGPEFRGPAVVGYPENPDGRLVHPVALGHNAALLLVQNNHGTASNSPQVGDIGYVVSVNPETLAIRHEATISDSDLLTGQLENSGWTVAGGDGEGRVVFYPQVQNAPGFPAYRSPAFYEVTWNGRLAAWQKIIPDGDGEPWLYGGLAAVVPVGSDRVLGAYVLDEAEQDLIIGVASVDYAASAMSSFTVIGTIPHGSFDFDGLACAEMGNGLVYMATAAGGDDDVLHLDAYSIDPRPGGAGLNGPHRVAEGVIARPDGQALNFVSASPATRDLAVIGVLTEVDGVLSWVSALFNGGRVGARSTIAVYGSYTDSYAEAYLGDGLTVATFDGDAGVEYANTFAISGFYAGLAGAEPTQPVVRNLVINPSGEQSFNKAWGASGGTVAAAVAHGAECGCVSMISPM